MQNKHKGYCTYLLEGVTNQHGRSTDLLDATGFIGDEGATNTSTTENKTVRVYLENA